MKFSSLVSIVMPAYNAADFIGESIESVQQQTYPNWELIIIDDGSTDETFALAEQYQKKDKRIRLVPLPVNQGAGFCRNIGIKAAEGAYIAFLDADDLWKAQKLQKQLEFMHREQVQVCYSSYELMDEQGQKQPYMIKSLKTLSFKKLLKANYIGNLTGIYKVENLGKIYNPPIRKRQDWAMWIRAVKKAGVAKGIPEPLATYRLRNNSISGNKWELLQYNYQVYRKVLKFSTFKSIWYFIQFLFEQFFVKSRRKVRI